MDAVIRMTHRFK